MPEAKAVKKQKPLIISIPAISFEIAADDLGVMTWPDAIAAANKFGDGWRLPTIKELQIIYENKEKVPNLKLTGSDADRFYWSSQSNYSYRTWAWGQYLDDGAKYYTPKDDRYSVRLVR